MNANNEEIEKMKNEVRGIDKDIEKLKNEMNGMLVLKWSDPLDENSSYGQPMCRRARLADGMWILGNPKFGKAIVDELEMENAKTSPRPITSARSAEEVDSREPDAIFGFCDSGWVNDNIAQKSAS
eukprot:12470231-Heterocapsa_arctica.AAC.1